jgi:hypothetical protein
VSTASPFPQPCGPSECNFPRLQSLTLQGFVFETTSFHDCLIIYADTLRTLRILDSWCIDPYGELVAMLNTTLSSAHSLSGVEIYGLRFLHPIKALKPVLGGITNADPEEVDEEVSQEMGNKIKGRRRLDWEIFQREGRQNEFPTFNERFRPCERPESEGALLAGRDNMVIRRVKAAETQKDREDWENKLTCCV